MGILIEWEMKDVQREKEREREATRWKEENTSGQALVAHVCNPSYSGSRDQEDQSWKPTQANGPQDRILKILDTNKGW
jgi:hypothetical protein